MLRIVPLGGLGEIGLNSMAVESNGEMLLVDAGVLFPTAEMPGVDVIIPDYQYVRENRERLRGVFLTHGHEDHIGSLASVLREAPVPVYGGRFTLALLRERLAEAGVEGDLREVSNGERIEVSNELSLEPLRVTHSIPDAFGFALRTRVGVVVHTGDFKLDPDPIDGPPTDLGKLGTLGDEGVLCLLSDSTNAEHDNEAGSERIVERTFDSLFARAQGRRVVVAMFASHVNRLRHLIALCARTGRRVLLNGRSMRRNGELAQQLGLIDVPTGLFIEPDETSSVEPGRVAIVSTGAQAERFSGLWQMTFDENAVPRVQPGDMVIVSARPIPGNERAVGDLINRLEALGAEVVYAQTHPGVHVSGHAGRPEQRQVIELLRPRHFVPIHGELRMLKRHLELAREAGVAESGLLLARDGDVVAFADGRGRLAGNVPAGRLIRDRSGAGDVLAPALRERLRLADGGLLVATVVLDADTGALISGPLLKGRGLTEDDVKALGRAEEEARGALTALSPEVRADTTLVEEELTRAIRRALRPERTRRANVLPIIVRI